ncbi:hypothetical protein A3D84_05375 [Candidatus Woesebacteria bacterium RIFCSPHIGHO2_02_FULL_42_20]|uniref:VOC domain-containing protein n=1 Tax=Candidatus Woesebacteria bacterium RIFCSPHIGHO2_12_FULL_41_24 TaxID=1802510 RepID=A0A1F8APT8_9BACT|nr:MAG: hypothetical protein A2W15_04635 [Candidatus Woesebacteria bacterium RBG_16_41_13]OGM34620.1 MAG: hypothetical protein A3D84_05375 [Candidatus Woesebacteria bacterium RIFCSPHIGHO2_02_FULL_42_20]OGM53782.1 MAG: hypothetical protein A3E44_05180 [Candidatus Woesebacteria bacterium RIFCSPHIGHO2_12_FULL_41_24]OGM71190.1 MAG: hypothetical protein A3I55_05205 [Candidatus Woesebacteria bacterium RIFCSPLOWO2_02_FULL_42_10]
MKLDSAVLYSNDINKAIEFYRDIIGLKVEYVEQEKYASFLFDNARLGVKKKVEKREIPGAQTIFIATDSIEKDYKRMIKEDVNFIKHMQVRPWGNEFSVVDPDGNKVEFIQRK